MLEIYNWQIQFFQYAGYPSKKYTGIVENPCTFPVSLKCKNFTSKIPVEN